MAVRLSLHSPVNLYLAGGIGKNAREAILVRYDRPSVADANEAAIRHIPPTTHEK